VWSLTLTDGDAEKVRLSGLTADFLILSHDGISQGVPVSSVLVLRHRVGAHTLLGAIVGAGLGFLAGEVVSFLNHGLGSDGTASAHSTGAMTVVAYTTFSGGLGALIGSQISRSERIDLRGMTDVEKWRKLSDLLSLPPH
jgi:hypothetical protein